MNKKLLMLGLIVTCINSYGYKGKPNNTLFSLEDIRNSEESKSYKGLAKTLDEINKREGKYSDYMSLTKDDNFDNFKYVTVAHLSDNTKRFFLGKGNNIDNIEVMSSEKFNEKEKDNFEYKLDGIYTRVADDVTVGSSVSNYIKDELNPLKITSKSNFKDTSEVNKEYETKILGRNKSEILNFFKEKLVVVYPNENFIVENEKIYVVDKKNQKWEIEYNYIPITKASPIGADEDEKDREYNDLIYTPIFKYKEARFDPKSGRVFYNLDKDIRVEQQGDVSDKNNIEFSGKGKISNLIYMPEEASLNIINTKHSNTGTSKYGNNVIFGSDLELKNVHRITVSKDSTGGNGGRNIISSGPTTLSFELDGTKKNDKGYYYKHVLNNTKNKDEIIFIQYGGSLDWSREESLNDFNIRLMVSSLNENGVVDMGRRLNYSYKGKYSTKNLNLSFISDSFMHALIKRTDDPNSDENNLLDVEIRDSIKNFSNEENEVYKSIVNSKKISILSETTSSVLKNIDFKHIDNTKSKNRDLEFAKALQNSTPEEILSLSEKDLTEKEKKIIIKEIEALKGYNNEILSAVEYDINRLKSSREYLEKEYLKEKKGLDEFTASLPEKKSQLNSFYNSLDYKEANFSSIEKEFINLNSTEIRDKFKGVSGWQDLPSGDTSKNKIESFMQGMFTKLDSVLNKFQDLDITRNYERLKSEYTDELNILNGSSWKKNTVGALRNVIEKVEEIENLIKEIPNYEKYLNEELSKKESVVKEKELPYIEALEKERQDPNNFYVEKLYSFGRDYSLYYPKIKELMFYTLREEQSLNEFKTMVSQLQDTNIWAKMNKVAKNELTTYTNIPFDIIRSLGEKKHLARGGYISARNVQQNFKGNTYTAYGLYEKQIQDNLRLGLMVGGSTTNHTLTHNKRTAETTPTTSTSKGVSAYIGTYAGKKLYQELNWISGVGFQYGKYDITRNLRNNYQTLISKGSSNIMGLNTYSGLILDYPLQEDVIVQVKGILSYSFINQGKVREKEGLNLDIQSKNYQYLDSEIGVNFSKTLYDFGVKSNLSAGVSRVMGVYGYKNSNLNAKVSGSSSLFGIKGDKVQKDALKLFIDYNVQKDSGLNYGLDGTYITNSKETDVRFGFKAGYTF